MKKNVPDERKTKTILELICALDGRIVKVEDAGDGLLVIYANIAQYSDDADLDDEIFEEDDDLLDEDDDLLDEALIFSADSAVEEAETVYEEEW